MNDSIVRLKILNWESYNEKRKDVSNPTWFRLNKSFTKSESLFRAGAEGKYLFIALLCLACEKNSSELTFDLGWFIQFYAPEFTQERAKELLSTLNGGVLELGDVTSTARACNERVTSTSRARHEDGPLQDITRQDKTVVVGEKKSDSPIQASPPAAPKKTTTTTTEISFAEGITDPVVREIFRAIGLQKDKQKLWLGVCGEDATWLQREIKLCVAHYEGSPPPPGTNLTRLIYAWLKKEYRSLKNQTLRRPVMAYSGGRS